jgi:hypothetical protein
MQASAATAKTLSYVLPNGIRVQYPASDQAVYLASILRSLYEHDRFVRRIMTGLAGRDVRRPLEIFLDSCTSAERYRHRGAGCCSPSCGSATAAPGWQLMSGTGVRNPMLLDILGEDNRLQS